MTQLRLGDDDGSGALTLGGARRPNAAGRGMGTATPLSAGSPLSTPLAGGLTLTLVEAGQVGQGGGGGNQFGPRPRTQLP